MPSRDKSFNVWVSVEELAYIEAKANEMGLSKSAYIRYKTIYEDKRKRENGGKK